MRVQSHAFARSVTRVHRLGVWQALPDALATRARWPLVVFLHGSGERGTDLGTVARHGLPRRIADGASFPFVTLAPQCPDGQWWHRPALDALLEDALERLPVDPRRVYLTGMSMGGYAAWEWATERPERFAALAPVCGGGYKLLAHRLAHLPIWAFHGADDDVIPADRTDEMVAAVRAAGGQPRYTRYQGVGHDCWRAAYATDELYVWMLAQQRPA